MAKPKRFQAQQFTQKLDLTIDIIIKTKLAGIELTQTDVQVRDIYQAFAVNSATLRRWCQEHTGLSPSRYLAEYRVEQAKDLLIKGLKPAAVAQRLAFTEHKNFSSVFKRTTDITPSQYIQKISDDA